MPGARQPDPPRRIPPLAPAAGKLGRRRAFPNAAQDGRRHAGLVIHPLCPTRRPPCARVGRAGTPPFPLLGFTPVTLSITPPPPPLSDRVIARPHDRSYGAKKVRDSVGLDSPGDRGSFAEHASLARGGEGYVPGSLSLPGLWAISRALRIRALHWVGDGLVRIGVAGCSDGFGAAGGSGDGPGDGPGVGPGDGPEARGGGGGGGVRTEAAHAEDEFTLLACGGESLRKATASHTPSLSPEGCHPGRSGPCEGSAVALQPGPRSDPRGGTERAGPRCSACPGFRISRACVRPADGAWISRTYARGFVEVVSACSGGTRGLGGSPSCTEPRISVDHSAPIPPSTPPPLHADTRPAKPRAYVQMLLLGYICTRPKSCLLVPGVRHGVAGFMLC